MFHSEVVWPVCNKGNMRLNYLVWWQLVYAVCCHYSVALHPIKRQRKMPRHFAPRSSLPHFAVSLMSVDSQLTQCELWFTAAPGFYRQEHNAEAGTWFAQDHRAGEEQNGNWNLFSYPLIQTSFHHYVTLLKGNERFSSAEVPFLPSNLTSIFSTTTRHKYCSGSPSAYFLSSYKLTHVTVFQITCWEIKSTATNWDMFILTRWCRRHLTYLQKLDGLNFLGQLSWVL